MVEDMVIFCPSESDSSATSVKAAPVKLGTLTKTSQNSTNHKKRHPKVPLPNI